MNKKPSVAKEYEALKLSLAKEVPIDAGRERYLAGKHDFIISTLKKAAASHYLGKTVKVKIDRPIGYTDSACTYPVNYGYLPKVAGGNGEKLEVYLLGVDKPVDEYVARVIGVIYRSENGDSKLVAAPKGVQLNQVDIMEQTYFQEQFYKSTIEYIYHKSCGAIIYRDFENVREYLLLLQKGSMTWSFPKGHMEMGETERQTAAREILEETGLSPEILPQYRWSLSYPVNEISKKELVLYLARTEDTPKICDNEIVSYCWLSAKNAKKRLYSQYASLIDTVESILN